MDEKVNDSTSSATTTTISLDPSAYDPLACSNCSRVFANYTLWVRHACAQYNNAIPSSVPAAQEQR